MYLQFRENVKSKSYTRVVTCTCNLIKCFVEKIYQVLSSDDEVNFFFLFEFLD